MDTRGASRQTGHRTSTPEGKEPPTLVSQGKPSSPGKPNEVGGWRRGPWRGHFSSTGFASGPALANSESKPKVDQGIHEELEGHKS